MSPFTDYSILTRQPHWAAAPGSPRRPCSSSTTTLDARHPHRPRQQHGFSIQFAEDGLDGVRLAESSDIDLIILDLTLPGLTGFDVCRRLRAAGVEVPIVMVSASSDPVDVVVGLEIGADDYIIKPFEVRELAARINAKLRRQRTTQSQVRPGRLKFPD